MERAGRKGKTVTLISGLPVSGDDLKELLKSLKQQCGTGGAVTDGDLEIQGDHRDRLVELLIARGIPAKRG
jgi:translation initiation factor 1